MTYSRQDLTKIILSKYSDLFIYADTDSIEFIEGMYEHMKHYTVTIYTRSNACISPNKVVFQHTVGAKTAKKAKLYTWQYFDAWFNSLSYSRHDLRIEAKPFTAE